MAISLTGFIFIAVCLCAIIALILDHIKKRPLYREAAKLVGPPTLPFFGSSHYFLGSSKYLLRKMVNLMDVYPSPFPLWMGNKLFFVLHEPEHLKTVMSSYNAVEKEDIYKFANDWVGTGLLTAPTAKWRVHRKLIVPTFNQRILDSFVQIFAKQSEILVGLMKKELNKGEFDIFDYISLCTLDIICETAMGVKIKAQTGYGIRYVDSVKRLTEILTIRAFRPWLTPNFIFNLTKYSRDQRECLKYMQKITYDVIRTKKAAYNDATRLQESSASKESLLKPFLDLLMELSKDGTKLTDVELREEVDTMLIAGNDTTATVQSFVLLMLAIFPEVQEKVYQELCDIYGDKVSSNISVKKEDLSQMQYLERVIRETMRLFPVGPVLARKITDDIKMGDLTLPKGSSVLLGIIKLHRNEKYWPDPLKFDPDRFLPEEVAKRDPYWYMPFSAGRRNCIGIAYAMMAMKALLSTLVRRYVVTKDKLVDIQDIKLKIDLMLKPVVPLTIKIVERTTVPKINNK